MTHEIKIESETIKTAKSNIFLDGIQIENATAFYMSQDVGETPEISIRFKPETVKFEQNCNVRVYNKEEIAKCMDFAEFIRFCDIWKEIHK